MATQPGQCDDTCRSVAELTARAPPPPPPQLRSINRLSHFSNKVSSFTMRIAEFVALFLLALHWNTCTQFLVAVATGFPDGCWVVELGTPPPTAHVHTIKAHPTECLE